MDRQWCETVAEIIAVPADHVAARARHRSFTQLGGTSLACTELIAVAERRFGLRLDLGRLLSADALADVVAAASPVAPAPPVTAATRLRPPLDGQVAMLASEQLHGGTAYHLMFSGTSATVVDPVRVRRAIATLAARHEALRTSFTRSSGGQPRRVVHDGWVPPLVEHRLPYLADDQDLTNVVHHQLAATSPDLLRPYGAPPVGFVLSTTPDRPETVLTILIHHVLVDGWSIGLLWRQLVREYGQPSTESLAGPDPQAALAHAVGHLGSRADRARHRAAQLAGTPTTLELPQRRVRPQQFCPDATRLPFTLPARLRTACERTASDTGITRNSLLFAAWALTVARRCDVADLLLGLAAANRTSAALTDTVSLCTRVVPTRCVIRDDATVRTYLKSCAKAVAEAVSFADVPLDVLVTETGAGGDPGRNPLVQIAFAAHDGLIPDSVRSGDLKLRITEGHCGGTPFDALLYVRHWSAQPVLALEYAMATLAPDEAAGLVESFIATLEGLTAAPEADLGSVRGMSARQEALIRTWGTGPAIPEHAGLWQLFEATVAAHPSVPALRDDARSISYAELLSQVERLSSALVETGVREGDRVVVAVPPGLDEITAVLAAVRLGAAYVGVDADAPAAQRNAVLALAAPAAVVVNGTVRGFDGVSLVPVDAVGTAPLPPVPSPDPERVTYIAFTSGSTGQPKGVRVPERGVVRLVHQADYVRRGPGEVYLRLAPLAFDASTLEIFAPLTSGACLAAYPDELPTPSDLAEFLDRHGVSVAWLTAGLFRIVADNQPAAFAGLRQLLTGGDVVPAAQARTVLELCPGLRITNGYGPTENTTFTTVHHMDDPADVPDDIPIGRPIPGTQVAVLDHEGRPVPPGGVGELYVSGAGLALDYVRDPAATSAVFVEPASFVEPGSESVPRMYRTGDLVRWDRGVLRFLGRRDRQVKVAGHRVELAAVEQAVRSHPAVADAYVGTVGSGATLRVVAGVVAADRPGLVDELRAHVMRAQPRYAVPSQWAVVDALPVTANGKVDIAALSTATADGDAVAPPTHDTAPADPPPAASPEVREPGDIEQLVMEIWENVLGHDDFDSDDGFFDVGGTSLQLAVVCERLRSSLPQHRIRVVDLYRYPSAASLARHLQKVGT